MSYRDAVMAAKYAGGSNEQATALHQRRLETVIDGRGYFDFESPRGIVVHVVPTGVYDDGYAIDLGGHSVLPEADPSRPEQLPVLGRDGARGSWTGDGFGAVVETDERDAPAGYAHLFSNGVVESVSAIPFESSESDAPRLDGRTLELELTRCVRRYLRVLAYHQRMAPVHVALSVFGTDGLRLDASGKEVGDATAVEGVTEKNNIINEGILAPFPVTFENYDVDVREALSDPIDALWRGAGRPGSPFVSGDTWALRSEFTRTK
ncbi:hypothetical protein [Haladaptatus sp. T7]|uniref:hypothetical protein n=1 Tax=Haladaptatus sp. T7 TaxID=2029368 RepID=UPI0021A258CC|nr:hypothetical protein [Haladaptatus sp. T7]GKZ15612.1 hypothetical protein HAL_34930 [Haladaptatus sp. T7]